MEEIEMPWQPRTRQVEGRLSEARLAKKLGARLHPMSGAGRIKDDMSTDDHIIEAKDANLSYTLKSSDLDGLFRRAVQQGKEPLFIVTFKNNIIAEIHLRKEGME